MWDFLDVSISFSRISLEEPIKILPGNRITISPRTDSFYNYLVRYFRLYRIEIHAKHSSQRFIADELRKLTGKKKQYFILTKPRQISIKKETKFTKNLCFFCSVPRLLQNSPMCNYFVLNRYNGYIIIYFVTTFGEHSFSQVFGDPWAKWFSFL